MKLKHILLVVMMVMLLCSIGMVSAADETSETDSSGVTVGNIVEMDKVIDYGKIFWDGLNKSNGAGYLLLSIGLVGWMVLIIGAAFLGSGAYALGKQSKNGDMENEGTSRLKNVAIAAIAPPLIILLLVISTGLL